MGRLPSLIAGLCLLAAACDDVEKAPAKSRVQAVREEPGNTTPRPEPSAAPSEERTGLAPAKPRAVLCADQLGQAPAMFKPKARAERRSLEGQDLPADPLKSDKRWTWVNFWAAWCVPCKEELPLLLRWQSSLGKDLRFAFVSLDDDERQLRAFLEDQPSAGLKSTYWLPDGPTRQAWLEALKLDSEPELPLQLLLDPSGKLRCRVQGTVEAQDLATLKKIVES